MKARDLNILKNVVNVYDQTKTTVFGNMGQRTIGGIQTLAPPPNVFLDVITDTALIPNMIAAAGSGYVFQATASAGLISVLCYNFDYTTGANSYAGRLNLTTPIGAQTLRGFKVIVNGTRADIFALVTNTTLPNAGLYYCNALLSDFVPVGFATIPLANTGETNALRRVFSLQESGTNGGGGSNLLTSGFGLGILSNTSVLVGNGVAATYQVYKFSIAGTLTSTSAAGVTTDAFTGANGFKTGNLPVLTGTVLSNNSMDIGVIQHTSNTGQTCLFIGTSSNMYSGQVSDLSAGATTWPSLIAANNNSGATDQIIITATSQNFSATLDKMIVGFGGKFYIKGFVNNVVDLIIGGMDSTFYEAQYKTVTLGSSTVIGTDSKLGWIFMSTSTNGQRGIFACDIRSDQMFDFTYFITPVIDLTQEVRTDALQVRNVLRGASSSSKIYFRTSGFASSSGGWTALPDDFDTSSIPSGSTVQFKFACYVGKNSSALYAAIAAARVLTTPFSELSDNWVGSNENTTSNGVSPSYTAFRLAKAYATSVPQLFFRAYDDSKNLVATADTVTNPSMFEYSSNNGTSWTALGTIPNTILTTEVRYKWATPPGVNVTVSIRES